MFLTKKSHFWHLKFTQISLNLGSKIIKKSTKFLSKFLTSLKFWKKRASKIKSKIVKIRVNFWRLLLKIMKMVKFRFFIPDFQREKIIKFPILVQKSTFSKVDFYSKNDEKSWNFTIFVIFAIFCIFVLYLVIQNDQKIH